MIFNIYKLLVDDDDVTNLVADRIYLERAYQKAVAPFVVWQIIDNVPNNSLSCRPDSDEQRVQIDGYAADPKDARHLALVLRNCIERRHTVVSGPESLGPEDDTELWRYTMEAMVFYVRSETPGD